LSLSPPFISINLSILSSRPDSSAHLNGFYFRVPVSASTTLSHFLDSPDFLTLVIPTWQSANQPIIHIQPNTIHR
jgi:hypothetical protein